MERMIFKLERGKGLYSVLYSGFMLLIHGCTSLAGKLRYPFFLLRICLESCEIFRNRVPRTALFQVRSTGQHQASSDEVFCIFWNMGELHLQSSTVQRKYNVNRTCDFNFSGSHMKLKETGEMNFNMVFYSTKYIQNVISTCNPKKEFILRNFTFLLLYYFQNPVSILPLWSIAIQNGCISSAQQLHVAGGRHIGKCRAGLSMEHSQGCEVQYSW